MTYDYVVVVFDGDVLAGVPCHCCHGDGVEEVAKGGDARSGGANCSKYHPIAASSARKSFHFIHLFPPRATYYFRDLTRQHILLQITVAVVIIFIHFDNQIMTLAINYGFSMVIIYEAIK